jgi:hypothetical protein
MFFPVMEGLGAGLADKFKFEARERGPWECAAVEPVIRQGCWRCLQIAGCGGRVAHQPRSNAGRWEGYRKGTIVHEGFCDSMPAVQSDELRIMSSGGSGARVRRLLQAGLRMLYDDRARAPLNTPVGRLRALAIHRDRHYILQT